MREQQRQTKVGRLILRYESRRYRWVSALEMTEDLVEEDYKPTYIAPSSHDSYIHAKTGARQVSLGRLESPRTAVPLQKRPCSSEWSSNLCSQPDYFTTPLLVTASTPP